MRGLFWRRPVLVFDRLTNLADGIFGVAMTFLAFTIQLPAAGEGPDGGLAGKLTALLPQLLTRRSASSSRRVAGCCTIECTASSSVATSVCWFSISAFCS